MGYDFDETLPGPWEWDLKRLAEFAERYADQNELDYGALAEAKKSGRIEANTDLV